MSEEEIEKQTLKNTINDLKDKEKYTGFKNGAFKYEIGIYQGTLLFNHINQLQQENKELKERIDNAIEYIETHSKTYSSRENKFNFNSDDLLEILEGDK